MIVCTERCSARTWPGEMKCGMSTNGIVCSAYVKSCSVSQPVRSDWIAAQRSPSFESSTRNWSLRSLTCSITALPPLLDTRPPVLLMPATWLRGTRPGMAETFKTGRRGRGTIGSVIDLDAASDFMATHARLLDRRRFDVLFRDAPPDGALAALSAYRNPDGGYGWGLEPDLRARESQPGGALHAFEVFEDVAPATSPDAVALCEWLASATLPDGGLPFALPSASAAGCAPFWAGADPTVSSLQITSVVTTTAHRVAAHDSAVADHPWLARATDYCLAAAVALGENPFAMTLAFAVQLLDAVHGVRPEADELLDRLG